MSKTFNKFGFIDSLRGLAILGVFLIHSTLFLGALDIHDLPLKLQNLFFFGKYGVALFFVVSAFTLYRSLDKRSGGEIAPIKNFFVRRFFRISPLYYLMLAFYLLFSVRSGDWGSKIYDFFLHIFYLNGIFVEHFNTLIGVAWSISTEMSFYLILPFLFKYCFSYKRMTILMGISCLISLLISNLSLFHVSELVHRWWYCSLFNNLLIFVAGGFLYKLFDEGKINLNFKQQKYVVLFSVVAMLINSYNLGRISVYHTHYDFNFLVAVLSVLSFFALFLCKEKLQFIRLLDNNFLRLLGQVSFSMYLIHLFIIEKIILLLPYFKMVLFNDFIAYIAMFSVSFDIAFGISYLLYEKIEKPGIALGKSLINKQEEFLAQNAAI